jgi:chromate transporter
MPMRDAATSAEEPGAGICVTAPGLPRLFLSFLRLGAVSFGGPAMVAFIRRLAVTRHRWLSEEDFLRGVALCQALPGATAMQCAAYVGWRIRGLRGALLAFAGFGLPAFLLMLALSVAYRQAAQTPAVAATLAGLRALVVALVAHATWTYGRSSVRKPGELALAVATGTLLFLGGNPFWIIVAAGLAGAWWLRGSGPARPPEPEVRRGGWRDLREPAVVLSLGACLVVALARLDARLLPLSLVMMKVDLFAFGGGFASVPLMFHEVVEARGWLPARAFMDGIALGQVTPGPIVITATFVGHQVAGLAGAIAGTIGVFLPSFVGVVLVEPWFRRFGASAALQGAIRGLVLSFVGLLASVTIQFVRLTPWNLPAIGLAIVALAALLFGVDVVWVVLGGAVAAALLPMSPS